MITLNLQEKKHDVKVGQKCVYKEPNITEDCYLKTGDEVIGFYINKLPEKLSKLADLANAEFRTDNVPKSLLERSDVFNGVYKDGLTRAESKRQNTIQMSTILGSIPPKPHMKRPYASRSSVHNVPSAQTFIKAMLMLAKESEQLIADILPEQYARQKELFKNVPDKWKFGNLFTSSISNYNISAPFHRDTGNIVGAVNVIICKKYNSKGGDLHVPDYDATFGQRDNSMLVYPAWKNIHGVTPIIPTHPGGYRNSLIFYPLKAFVDLQ